MYARLFCACCALYLVPGSAFAGTIVVTFEARPEDGFVQLPNFMSYNGFINGSLSSVGSATNLGGIGVALNAGNSPITIASARFEEFVAQAPDTPASFLASDPCEVTTLTPGVIPFNCQSPDGQLSFSIGAASVSADPPLDVGIVSIDDLVITGDDVSDDDLVWVKPAVPEPSSFTLLAVTAGVVASRRRRR
jgi:hypothetical protein